MATVLTLNLFKAVTQCCPKLPKPKIAKYSKLAGVLSRFAGDTVLVNLLKMVCILY